ncbi:hypothetical protein SDC9_154772 [bioreactor metagenome]|uniref:Uncharacterized protein n=1 Tax=bioreactor metagenome TaxID=1076179 RepID=A0A645F1X3_9ZZZZ
MTWFLRIAVEQVIGIGNIVDHIQIGLFDNMPQRTILIHKIYNINGRIRTFAKKFVSDRFGSLHVP